MLMSINLFILEDNPQTYGTVVIQLHGDECKQTFPFT